MISVAEREHRFGRLLFAISVSLTKDERVSHKSEHNIKD